MTKAGRNNTERLPEDVLTELSAIALTRATDVLKWEDGQVELKLSGRGKAQYGAAIAALEKTSGGWKVKFYDKLKALELLGSYLGLFGSTGGREEENSHLLEAILAATQEETDLSEIHEIQQATTAGHDLVEPSEACSL